MARVVPSIVIAVIDRTFPWAKQADYNSNIRFAEASNLAGIVDLLDRLPNELLTLDQNKYADFLSACGALRHEVKAFSSGTKEIRIWPRPGDLQCTLFRPTRSFVLSGRNARIRKQRACVHRRRGAA